MNILTLNCESGYRAERLSSFLTEINYGPYDALYFQEVSEKTLESLDSSIYNLTVLEPSHKIPHYSTVAIASKKTSNTTKVLEVVFEKQITPHHTHVFGAIGISTTYNGTPTLLISLHMPAYLQPFKRRRHLKTLLTHLERYRTTHHIIAGGDWNAVLTLDRWLIKNALGSKYNLIIPKEPTYVTENIEPGLFWNNFTRNVISKIFPTLTLDFFFSNKLGGTETVAVGTPISDHRPVRFHSS